MCNHLTTPCPNHEGAFDCTPFCNKCEGEQECCFFFCEDAND